MNTTKKILTGFIVGVAAGAAAGLLLAPQSGSRTRKQLSNESEKFLESLTSNVKQTVDDTIEALKKNYNSTSRDLSRNAKRASKEVRSALNV